MAPVRVVAAAAAVATAAAAAQRARVEARAVSRAVLEAVLDAAVAHARRREKKRLRAAQKAQKAQHAEQAAQAEQAQQVEQRRRQSEGQVNLPHLPSDLLSDLGTPLGVRSGGGATPDGARSPPAWAAQRGGAPHLAPHPGRRAADWTPRPLSPRGSQSSSTCACL